MPDYVVGRSPPEADKKKTTLGRILLYRYTLAQDVTIIADAASFDLGVSND